MAAIVLVLLVRCETFLDFDDDADGSILWW
jgi:hypothetical protein